MPNPFARVIAVLLSFSLLTETAYSFVLPNMRPVPSAIDPAIFREAALADRAEWQEHILDAARGPWGVRIAIGTVAGLAIVLVPKYAPLVIGPFLATLASDPKPDEGVLIAFFNDTEPTRLGHYLHMRFRNEQVHFWLKVKEARGRPFSDFNEIAYFLETDFLLTRKEAFDAIQRLKRALQTALEFAEFSGGKRTSPEPASKGRVSPQKWTAQKISETKKIDAKVAKKEILTFLLRLAKEKPSLIPLWIEKIHYWDVPEDLSASAIRGWVGRLADSRARKMAWYKSEIEAMLSAKDTLAPGAWGFWQTHLGWINVKSIGRLEALLLNSLLFSLMLAFHRDELAATGWHLAAWSALSALVFVIVPFLIHYYSGVVNPYDDKPKVRNWKAALGATGLHLIALAGPGLFLTSLGLRLNDFSSVWFVQLAANLFYFFSFYFTIVVHGNLNVLTTLFSVEKKEGQYIHRLPTDASALPVFGAGPDPVLEPDPETSPRVHRHRTIWFSDTHMGFRAFLSRHFLDFLRHNESLYLYAVGDFFDFWIFLIKRLWHWTDIHNTIIQKILKKTRKGTVTIYIPGNHDEAVRQFTPAVLGGVHIENAAIHVTADSKRYLIIHGDELDTIIRMAKWLSKLGSWAYDFIYVLDPIVNLVRKVMGMPRWSMAAYVKKRVKEATVFIDNFKYEAAKAAKNLECDGVICGHIHEAADEIIDVEGTPIRYLNPGSWVEGPDGTALIEDMNGRIRIIHWHELFGIRIEDDAPVPVAPAPPVAVPPLILPVIPDEKLVEIPTPTAVLEVVPVKLPKVAVSALLDAPAIEVPSPNDFDSEGYRVIYWASAIANHWKDTNPTFHKIILKVFEDALIDAVYMPFPLNELKIRVRPGEMWLPFSSHMKNEREAIEALRNVVINALKASVERSLKELIIETGHDGPYDFVRIMDRGKGMSAERSAQYGGDALRSQNDGELKGSGFGVRYLNGLIVGSGGHIDPNSEEGVGSVITLRWPAGAQAQSTAYRTRQAA